MTREPLLATFRDPAGSLTLEVDCAIRTIYPSSREAALAFLNSPFCHRLQARGDLISFDLEDLSAGLRLIHPRIAVPTYPWEWTPSQWQAAATLTLNLCREAVQEGWILKDATPLNILFVGVRPVFVDVLSFAAYEGQSYVWPAYAQYVRTFLLPLVMHQVLRWPLAATIFRRDGYEPAELYGALTWRQRLSRAAFWPVTLPLLLERLRSAGEPAPSLAPDAGDGASRLTRNLTDLERRTAATRLPRDTSAWSEYGETMAHYTPAQRVEKTDWVTGVLKEVRPHRTLDIGANTGEYSMIAARESAEVVSLERDAATADRLFCRSGEQVPSVVNLLTIHADLARPTPAVGWENRESSALLDRLEQQFDMVMMLALLHHLLLLDQIPLSAVIALGSRLTRRHLILEWVPATDPMYRSLLRGRDDLYRALTETDFVTACEGHFQVQRRHTLGNGRILFLLEKQA